MSKRSITRHDFLAGGAVAAMSLAAAGFGSGVAMASESASESAASASASASASETSASASASGSATSASGSASAAGSASQQKITETIDTDIVIIGGGFSGMACAVQSALNGDKVVLLESQAALGGGGMALEITCGVDSDLAAANGIHYEVQDLVRTEMGNAAWSADGGLWLDLIQNSGDNINWLVEQGVEYEPTVDEYHIMKYVGTYKVAHWYKDGYAGSGYVPQMTDRISGLDIDVRTATRATEFIFDADGKITGVYATVQDTATIQVNASVFVVATGSFAQDDDRLRAQGYNPEKIDILAMPGHFGDGIRMVLSAGGTEFIGGSSLIYNRIGNLMTFDALNGCFSSGGPFMWVNQDCRRYTDENISLERSMCPLQAEGTRINKAVYTVFDSTILNQVTGGDADLLAQWDQAITDNPGVIFTSDDLYELPTLAGLDADAFKAEVDQYNAFADAGVDGEFGKDPTTLLPIKDGPFYMAQMHMAMEGPLYGVNIDRHFRAVNLYRDPIENLFVIGLDSMSLYRSTYPMAVPGSASAECINGARTASNEAHAYLEANGLLSSSDDSAQDLTPEEQAAANGRAVMKSAVAILNKNELVADGTTPQTITSEDLPDLFNQVSEDTGLTVENCTLECDVETITSETVRGTHEAYKYTVTSMDATIDGQTMHYDVASGYVLQ